MDLKSVMFCDELGGGRGHIAKAALLAEKLLDAGCEITFASRDLAEVHALLPMAEYRLVQSPVWMQQPAATDEPASYAELLLQAGFASPAGLVGLTRAWRSLFQAFRVDLVIADHAPNALLAARIQGVPAALYGNGFFAPPPVSPLPPYRTWESCPPERLASAESLALQSANRCLRSFGAPEMTHLHELLAVDESFLCTVPELDHYQGRESSRYCGPVYVDQVGGTPVWPAIPGTPAPKKIFACLDAQMPGLEAILRSLAASGAVVLVYAQVSPRRCKTRWMATPCASWAGWPTCARSWRKRISRCAAEPTRHTARCSTACPCSAPR